MVLSVCALELTLASPWVLFALLSPRAHLPVAQDGGGPAACQSPLHRASGPCRVLTPWAAHRSGPVVLPALPVLRELLWSQARTHVGLLWWQSLRVL